MNPGIKEPFSRLCWTSKCLYIGSCLLMEKMILQQVEFYRQHGFLAESMHSFLGYAVRGSYWKHCQVASRLSVGAWWAERSPQRSGKAWHISYDLYQRYGLMTSCFVSFVAVDVYFVPDILRQDLFLGHPGWRRTHHPPASTPEEPRLQAPATMIANW